MKSVESLREEATSLAVGADRFELSLPEALSVGGSPVPKDLAMAVLLDAILALGFMPDGVTTGATGAIYRYRRV